jgi:hypothetical protein
MGLEDIAMFRAIPTATIFYPSDGVSIEKAVELAASTKVLIISSHQKYIGSYPHTPKKLLVLIPIPPKSYGSLSTYPQKDMGPYPHTLKMLLVLISIPSKCYWSLPPYSQNAIGPYLHTPKMLLVLTSILPKCYWSLPPYSQNVIGPYLHTPKMLLVSHSLPHYVICPPTLM